MTRIFKMIVISFEVFFSLVFIALGANEDATNHSLPNYFIEGGIYFDIINTSYKGGISGSSKSSTRNAMNLALGQNFWNGHVQLIGTLAANSNDRASYYVHTHDATHSSVVPAKPDRLDAWTPGILLRGLLHYRKGTIYPLLGFYAPLPCPNYLELGINFFNNAPVLVYGLGFYWDLPSKMYFLIGFKMAIIKTSNSQTFGTTGQRYDYSSTSRHHLTTINLGYNF